jgi:hypothetical protein
VNFFGHAVAASWSSDEPRFALGAMLPDFSSMARGRVVEVGDADVGAGVAHHHDIDRAFHRLPAFRDLCRDADARLRRAGMRRGPSLGASHVVIELLLDGVLVGAAEPEAGDLYVEAVQTAAACPDDLDLEWRDPTERSRWRSLMGKLAERGLPVGYLDLTVVTERVRMVLSRRPRLAMTDQETTILRGEVGSIGGLVSRRSDELIEPLRSL